MKAPGAPGAINEYLGYLRAVRNVSERTLLAYGKDLERFAAYCVNYGLSPESAASPDVERFIADLSAERIAPVSVNRALSSLRGFYRWLIRFGKRADDPSADIRNLKTPGNLPEFLWEGEMAAFAALPEKEGILWPSRDKALILVMYSAGLRISELVSLSVDSLDESLEGARVLGKGNKERSVFFSEEASTALSAYLFERKLRVKAALKSAGKTRAAPTNRVFINRHGGPISVSGVRWIINCYGGRAGLGKHVHPHALRHSFATHLVNSGCDVRIVQEMLGHASVSTTQRYAHLDMERLRAAYMNAHPHARTREHGAPPKEGAPKTQTAGARNK